MAATIPSGNTIRHQREALKGTPAMRIEVSEKEKAELIEHARQWGDWIQRSPCDERSLRAYYHGQGIGEVLLLQRLGVLSQAESEALRRELDAHRRGGE